MKRIKMAWLICALVAVTLSFFAWSTSRAAYESADYRVIESDRAFEIREYPELKLVKISEQSIREQESRLLQWLAAQGFAADGQLEVAGYDPPWMPGPLRRNEVLVRIKAQPRSAARN